MINNESRTAYVLAESLAALWVSRAMSSVRSSSSWFEFFLVQSGSSSMLPHWHNGLRSSSSSAHVELDIARRWEDSNRVSSSALHRHWQWIESKQDQNQSINHLFLFCFYARCSCLCKTAQIGSIYSLDWKYLFFILYRPNSYRPAIYLCLRPEISSSVNDNRVTTDHELGYTKIIGQNITK